MFALLSYPVLFEPAFATRAQAIGWSFGYAGFVALCGITAWMSRAYVGETGCRVRTRGAPPPARGVQASLGPAAGLRLRPAAGRHQSSLAGRGRHPVPVGAAAEPLPADVHHLLRSREMVLARHLSARSPWSPWAAWPTRSRRSRAVKVSIPLFSAGLFLCCMVCHGELVRLKPHAAISDHVLPDDFGGRRAGRRLRRTAGAAHLPRRFRAADRSRPPAPSSCWWCSTGGTSLWYLGAGGRSRVHRLPGATRSGRPAAITGCMVRNFYGSLKVEDPDDPKDPDAVRKLVHGTINHGQQFLDPRAARLADHLLRPQLRRGAGHPRSAGARAGPDRRHRAGHRHHRQLRAARRLLSASTTSIRW